MSPPDDTQGEGSEVTVDELVAAVDNAAGSVDEWFYISGRLKELLPGNTAGWLLSAFDYSLTRPGRIQAGTAAFGSQMSGPGFTYPYPLPELPDEALALWERCAGLATTAAVRARLSHLCFERKWGSSGTHLQQAAKAYLEVGLDNGWQRLARADSLGWALEMAKKLNDDALVSRAVDALVDLAEISMAQEQAEAGVALCAIEAVLARRPDDLRLSALLDLARLAYPDAFITEGTIAMQRQLAKRDPRRRKALDREEVETWLAEAGRATGMVKSVHLERAIRLAGDRGFVDLVKAATTELQQLDPDDLGFVDFSSSIEIPAAEFEKYLAFFTEVDSVGTGLARLLLAGPPSGTLEQTQEAVREAAGHISSLFRPVRVNREHLPAWHPTNPAEEEDERLAQQETLRLQVHGPLTAEILSRILAKFEPSEDELVDVLENPPHCIPEVARSIARALGHYAWNDFEAASCVVMPKIEALTRRLALSVGLAPYRIQRGETQGQYPGLGVLLDSLQSRLDPSWYRFLRTFLVSPAGQHYRNDLSHGAVDTYDKVNTALLLLTALHLAALGDGTKEEDPAPDRRCRQHTTEGVLGE